MRCACRSPSCWLAPAPTVSCMAFEHPLAYMIGMEGLALLRAFGGEHDAAFVETRLEEIGRLLTDPSMREAGVSVDALETVTGYRAWSTTYDDPDNAAFGLEQPAVRRIIDAFDTWTVLDAACGTGRHTEYLAAAGHEVIGVDSSPEMLERARARVPTATFRLGNLDDLPIANGSVDGVVCALALTHLPEPGRAISEFARVLRPGGQLVISDIHHEMVLRGSVPPVIVDGRRGRVTNHRHHACDYLRPALAHGLRLRGCEEPRLPTPHGAAQPAGTCGPWLTWPWSLAAMIPEATAAANSEVPAIMVWHFEKPHT